MSFVSSAAGQPVGPDHDLRESLYNDRAIGSANQIQLPREAVTRLHALAVDLDADKLKPNPWFPPADTAEAFYAGIKPVLERHPVLQHAEIRDTGRWLHAILWFSEPVDLCTADEQKRWTAIHQVLVGSLPSDHAAPLLHTLTRPVGSTNSKTGGKVGTLKQRQAVSAGLLEAWSKEITPHPFESVGSVLFGNKRLSPCPYCCKPGSYLDLGAVTGFCYGRCRSVPINRLFLPIFKGVDDDRLATLPGAADEAETATRKVKRRAKGSTTEPQVIVVDGDNIVLRIDPTKVTTFRIESMKR